MLFHVEVGGRLREVSVERQADAFKVTIDGHPRLVNVASVDAATLSMFVLGDRVTSHEIGFADTTETNGSIVYVDGVAVTAALATRRPRTGGGADTVGGSGVQRMTAPMPGKVVRVLVTAGDRVQPRQPLVVVEAMKMENELRAVKAGSVREVTVQQGASVEAGTVLVVIE